MFKTMMTNMMREINNILLLIINLILGGIFVGFVIYRRFFVIRLPKSLWIWNDNVNYLLLLIIILGLILSLYQVFINAYYLIKKDNIKSKLFAKLNQFIENALFTFYSFISNRIPNIYIKISLLAENFYAAFHKHTECLLLFALYIIRIIIIIAFLFDIFAYFKLDYFYKALYLLCFSLFIKLLLYILRDFASNLEHAESLLSIQHQGIDLNTQLPITDFSLKEEYKKLDLDFYVKQYLLCSKLSGYFTMYDRYSYTFSPYINLIIYFIYAFGWSYVLYVNLISGIHP